MAREKDAFGFYFSAHPVSRYQALTDSLRARSYGELAAGIPAAPGERRPATMATLVESAKWRTSQRGNRYMQLTLSDRSGQFPASCFDEGACAMLEQLAESGGCAHLQVEIDWREGEEAPRVAVRSLQALEQLMVTRALTLHIMIDSADPLAAIAAIVGTESTADEGTGRGEILLSIAAVRDAAPIATLRIGSGYALNQDIVHRIERLPGVNQVHLLINPQNRRGTTHAAL